MLLDTVCNNIEINACNDIQLLNILSIFKSSIKLITIIVPVVLVIFATIDIIKTISSSEVDSKKLWKSISKRLIAAVFIFLIPFVIEIVIGIIPSGKFYYRDCYEYAEKKEVECIAKQKAEDSLNNFSSAIKKYSMGVYSYEEAYKHYEIARKDIKNMFKGSDKENYEKKLDNYKIELEEVKKGRK